MLSHVSLGIRYYMHICYAQTRALTTALQVSDTRDGQYKYDFGPYEPLIRNENIHRSRIRQILRLQKNMLENNQMVPQFITPDNMRLLLDSKSYTKRCRLMEYLSHKERKVLRKLKPSCQKQQNCLNMEPIKPSLDTSDPGRYGLFGNTIFQRIEGNSLNRFYGLRQCISALYGSKLVIDLGNGFGMTNRECNKAVVDIMDAYGCNRCYQDPFDLYFCNATGNAASLLTSRLFKTTVNPCMATLTKESYTDLFPRDDLVYLSPDAENILTRFDPNKVYIIGGLVDKIQRTSETYHKAVSEGIKTVRFPFKFSLMWEEGNKPLHITHVVKILLELKHTNDWLATLRRARLQRIQVYEPSSSIRIK